MKGRSLYRVLISKFHNVRVTSFSSKYRNILLKMREMLLYKQLIMISAFNGEEA